MIPAMKKFAYRFLALAVAIYCLLALPSVLLLLQSEYYRFQTWQELVRKTDNIVPTEYFFCGDSITASGRNWGLLLGLNPLLTLNQALTGAYIAQVEDQVEKAVSGKPKLISIMAGTNDVYREDFSVQVASNDFQKIFSIISKHPDISFLITSVPESKSGAQHDRIEALNSLIKQQASLNRNVQYIDLNAALAGYQHDRDNLYEDDVHLSPEGIALWADLIRSRLQ